MPSRDVFEKIAKEKGTQVAHAIGTSVRTAFPILNSYEGHRLPGSQYSIVRHTRSWVYYQGVSTTIPIIILGQAPLPPDRRIILQRRGWRTGMFGWNTRAVLGGNYGKDVDVTPERQGAWYEDVDIERRNEINKDLEQYMSEKYAPIGHAIQETDFIRIPVSSGDGYFRLVVCPHKSARSIIAATGVFRLGSLSSDSAHMRGASLGTLTPELALKHASNAVQSASQGVISTAIPLAQAFQTIPGTKKMGKWALDSGYRRIVGRESQGRYSSLEDVYHHLEDKIHETLPVDNIGVRTPYDLRADQRIGKGGMACKRSQGRLINLTT